MEIHKDPDLDTGCILMTDLFSDSIGITITDADPQMVINNFVKHWVRGQYGDGFGLPTNYIFTSTGQQLDTIEGKQLCEKIGLTWGYPNICIHSNFTHTRYGMIFLKAYFQHMKQ